MSDLPEESQWTPGIYQLETSDPVLGGPEGIDNLQAKQLASRTKWLKEQVALLGDGKQPLDATLTALASLLLTADKLIYATGVDTFATTGLSSFIRTLLDDVDAAAARTTLGAAPLASPALTGTPTSPTAAPGTNTQQLATTAFVAALGALKANLASPALTGTPTAPTATPGTNTLQLATTAFVQAAVAALVNSSPAALDTLYELATALGNDPNFATTIFNALGLKAPLASPVLTGNPQAPTPQQFDADASIATTEFVRRALGSLPDDPILILVNTPLTAAQAGNLFLVAEAYQITLPSLASTPNGSSFHFLFMKEGGSLKGSGAEAIQGISSANTYSAYRGEKVTLVKRNNAWYLGGGGLGAEAFLASIANSGYQKLPSGLILQWGAMFATATTTVTLTQVSLPIAFPNAALSCVGSRTIDLNTSNSPSISEFFTCNSTLASVTHVRSSGSVACNWKYLAIGY